MAERGRSYKEKRNQTVIEVITQLPDQLITALRGRLNETTTGLDFTMLKIAGSRADHQNVVFVEDALAAVDMYFMPRQEEDYKEVIKEDHLYKRHRNKIKELLSCFYPSTKNQVPDLLSHINQAASRIKN